MEMKEIDLTKCNNCRVKVRYRYDRVYEVTGRIEKVTEGGGEARMLFVADEDEELITMWEDGKICEHIMDFEIVPRDPETYQDWQVGDTIEYSDNYSTGRIIFRGGDFVAADIEGTCNCYTCEELFNEGYRLVLTDIEKQIIGEKKKYEPQDGDIVAWKEKEDEGDSAITIYRGNHRGYFTVFINGKSMGDNKYDSTLAMEIVRPAAEDEKQKLFDAMAKEDIPKPHEFKKGEPVLVRNYSDSKWRLSAFLRKSGSGDVAVSATLSERDCFTFNQCIPYNERTMHLLGTAEDYKEGE